MTVQVTGGLVAVEDGVKAAEDYAPARKVRFELKFDVAEGADGGEALDIVIDMANERLDRELGRRPRVGSVTTVAAEQEPAPRKRRTKAEMEAEKAAAEPDPVGTTGQPAQEPASSPPAEDDWSTPATPAEATKEITDAELAAATQKRNGELNDPPLIRALIGSFNPDPTKGFTLAEIPQAQRSDYLTKLAALAK